MSFLKVIPKCIANPKKIQYCNNCNLIIKNDRDQFCNDCHGRLNSLNYISYIAHIEQSLILAVCPNCNSFELNGKQCDGCKIIFDTPKLVDKVKWIKTNFPEVYQ